MNLLTGIVNGKEKVLLQKNRRFYTFVNRSDEPHTTIEAIDVWDKISEMDIAETKRPKEYGLPVSPEKILLPAVNFRSHSVETSLPELKGPYFFCKFQHAMLPHKGNVIRPRGVEQLDYEGEIGIVIGKRGKYIPEEQANEHVFGYTIVDDISLRENQNSGTQPYGKDWVMGKNADTALPIGPWITPKDEFPGFPTTIKTVVNGEEKQYGSTDDMIFAVPKLISRLSQVMTLVPGDIITTGTPSGVALHTGKKFLQPGDEVEITVEGIGTLKHGIVDEGPSQ